MTGADTPRELRLRLGGVTIALAWDDPSLAFTLDDPALAFLDPESSPDVAIAVQWADLSQAPRGELLFDAVGWHLTRADGGYLFFFASPAFGAVPYRSAWFSDDFLSGVVRIHRPYFTRRPPIYPLAFPLDELLMIHLLSRDHGIEIHASGLVDRDGAGYLFAGHSGAGKSTMSRLWMNEPGVTILSDDRIIVRQMGDRFVMYGTPWHGDAGLSSPASALLSHVFLLRHAERHDIQPLAGAVAVARLFARCFPPFHGRQGLDSTLATLHALTDATRCSELGSVPDPSVIEFVRRSVR